MAVEVERLEGCRELMIRCINTGTYCRWLLTEARGGTFVDAEFGMDPRTAGTRVFDVLAGKRYFRHWSDNHSTGCAQPRAALNVPPRLPEAAVELSSPS